MNKTIYQNPLISRYSSNEMSYIFSEENKFKLWRKLWVTLAESQKEMGLNITDKQIDELKKYQNDINYDIAEAREREVRHDVMSHVYAYGKQCKQAAPIIHLGATSCYVTDNSELMMMYSALNLIQKRLIKVISNLKKFATDNKDLATLAFTHFQPAQPTTVGKRAALWLYDLFNDFENIQNLINDYKLRGLKGTTGTQASFMQLFDNDSQKVKELEKKVLNKLGFKKSFAVTGQTYSRKFDYSVLALLSQIAQSAYKFSNDIRLLQSRKELEEPFEKNQIGSSAMAYKRNPMRCERIGALSRYIISLPINCSITASSQWLERTLDDSANRRIVLAEAFLACDAVLKLYNNVTANLVVYPNIINKYLQQELPFMATETILMECVKAGGDRQLLHEEIRKLSMQAAQNIKDKGLENNLIQLIKGNAAFSAVHNTMDEIMSAKSFTGRAAAQVEELLEEYIIPILIKYKHLLDESQEDIKI
ncbi:MAG: adenylosuccinate lyase [Clostridia bacterium]|nr:adenylosuccinate lyase [Clostridia bacterium]